MTAMQADIINQAEGDLLLMQAEDMRLARNATSDEARETYDTTIQVRREAMLKLDAIWLHARMGQASVEAEIREYAQELRRRAALIDLVLHGPLDRPEIVFRPRQCELDEYFANRQNARMWAYTSMYMRLWALLARLRAEGGQ